MSTPDLVKTLEQAKTDGNRFFQEGRIAEAVAAYEKGVDLLEDLLPSSLGEEVRKPAVAIYCNAAHALLKGAALEGQPAEQACAMANKALALEPANVKARFRRGCANALLENFSLAAADFRYVLKQEPCNDAARQELEKAQELLRVSFEDLMRAAESFKAEGAALFAAGSYFGAYEVWKKGADALKDAATDSDVARKLLVALCTNSAQALLRCTDVEGANTEMARAMAQKALALDPCNIKALFRRGCAYANVQDWQSAQADFSQVLRQEPSNEAARRELQKAEALAASPQPRGQARRVPDAAGESRLEPAQVVRTAQLEAERIRQETLDLAEARQVSLKWRQRFNKLQVRCSDWVKEQLADAEMLQDLAMVWGSLFEAMDAQEREDFLTAVEFAREATGLHGPEMEELRSSSPPGDALDASPEACAAGEEPATAAEEPT